MKKLLLVLVLSIIATLQANDINAQNSRLSFDISYPIPIGDTFYSNYDGLIGLGLKYEHPLSSLLYINGQIGYSAANFSYNPSLDDSEATTTANIFGITIGSSLNLHLSEKINFVPNVGIGYANVFFTNDVFDDQNSSNGLNTLFGLSIDYQLSSRIGLGVFSSYNFIYLEKPDVGLDNSFNREIHSISSGVKLIYSLN